MVQSNNFKISHFISTAGLMSRREAERAIIQGRVSINGVIATNRAVRVTPENIIALDGREVKSQTPRLFAFNKPTGYLVSHASQNGKQTIFQLIKIPYHLTFIGRLDYMSEGLLLLTNSPSLAHKLTQPGIQRVYEVTVDRVNPLFKKFLQNPILDGMTLRPIDLISCVSKDSGFMVELGLYEGKNREIRRICEFMKMRVRRLKRTIYAGIDCKGLRVGQIKEISLDGIKLI